MLATSQGVEGWHRLTVMRTRRLRNIWLETDVSGTLLQLVRVGGSRPIALLSLDRFPLIAYDSSSSIQFIELFFGGEWCRYEAREGECGPYEDKKAAAHGIAKTIEGLNQIAADPARGFPFQLIDRKAHPRC